MIRESNVTLRWLMLHTTQLGPSVSLHKRTRQLLEMARQEAKVSTEDVLSLVVLVSRLEQHTRLSYIRVHKKAKILKHFTRLGTSINHLRQFDKHRVSSFPF